MAASYFPGTPRLLKGAIIALDVNTYLPTVVAFQYNPETLTRKLEIPATSTGGANSESQRLNGPPVETISLEAEFDAIDGLEQNNPVTLAAGIHPQLAALEMLVYPSSSLLQGIDDFFSNGALEVLPPEGPLTLFVWGPQRVVPVRITELSVTEEAFDPLLNPIRAKVSLGLRVLSSSDLASGSMGNALYKAHQKIKEVMAATGTLASLGAIGVSTFG